MSFYRKCGKRLLDIFISGMVLFGLSPVIVIVSVLIYIKLGAPVIFCQERPGLNGSIFKMYKFRTMTDGRDTNGKLLPDEQRLTAFGQVLRKTSLDELPEFFNILKGDMSLIGPRPLLVKYLPYYTEKENMRHQVRPGLTGLAQVHGRNTCIWEERFRYDQEYVTKLSFWLDCRIVWMTVQKVIRADDIVSPGVLEDFDVYRKKQMENPDLQDELFWRK